MPRHNNDLYVRGQVLDAYRALDDPIHEPKAFEGSVLRKTQAIIYNQEMRRKQQIQQELQDYYRIGQLWNEEVEHIWDPRERKTVLRGLAQILPRREAVATEGIYQLFQYKPEALPRLTGMTKTNIATMGPRAFEELQQEVQMFQRDFDVVEHFLDV